MNNRRKFRSQTFDNMDRWKAEMGRVREEKRREEKRREEKNTKKNKFQHHHHHHHCHHSYNYNDSYTTLHYNTVH